MGTSRCSAGSTPKSIAFERVRTDGGRSLFGAEDADGRLFQAINAGGHTAEFGFSHAGRRRGAPRLADRD